MILLKGLLEKRLGITWHSDSPEASTSKLYRLWLLGLLRKPQSRAHDLITHTSLGAFGSLSFPPSVLDKTLTYLKWRFSHVLLFPQILNLCHSEPSRICHGLMSFRTTPPSEMSLLLQLDQSSRCPPNVPCYPVLARSASPPQIRFSLCFLFPNLPTLKVYLKLCLFLKPSPHALTLLVLYVRNFPNRRPLRLLIVISFSNVLLSLWFTGINVHFSQSTWTPKTTFCPLSLLYLMDHLPTGRMLIHLGYLKTFQQIRKRTLRESISIFFHKYLS